MDAYILLCVIVPASYAAFVIWRNEKHYKLAKEGLETLSLCMNLIVQAENERQLLFCQSLIYTVELNNIKIIPAYKIKTIDGVKNLIKLKRRTFY